MKPKEGAFDVTGQRGRTNNEETKLAEKIYNRKKTDCLRGTIL
jgi:hypothetical protein